MVPTAAGRGQGGCLQGREMGQQRDRHMVGTGPHPTSSPVLGNPQVSLIHRGDADPLGHGSGRFWGSAWPPSTAGSPHLLCIQPKHTGQDPASQHSQVQSDPSNQIYSKRANAEAGLPQSGTGCLLRRTPTPGRSLSALFISRSRADPGVAQGPEVTSTWRPSSCFLPRRKAGLQAAGALGQTGHVRLRLPLQERDVHPCALIPMHSGWDLCDQRPCLCPAHTQLCRTPSSVLPAPQFLCSEPPAQPLQLPDPLCCFPAPPAPTPAPPLLPLHLPCTPPAPHSPRLHLAFPTPAPSVPAGPRGSRTPSPACPPLGGD